MKIFYVFKCFLGYIFIMCLIGIIVINIVRKIIKIILYINIYGVNGFNKYVWKYVWIVLENIFNIRKINSIVIREINKIWIYSL